MGGMSSLLRVTAAVVAVAASAAPADAFRTRSTTRTAADREVVVLPAAGLSRPLRDHVELAWQQVPAAAAAAWQRLRTAVPGLTRSSWDLATGVPSRIWGRGVEVPGALADPAVAEAAARRFLAEHLALLAPGAGPADFELVANQSDGDLRTVAFIQRHAGLEVLGGQVSFRFKHDRLFVIGSEALPHVRLTLPGRVLAGAALRTGARTATAAELGVDPSRVTADPPGALTIVPLIGERGVLGYRVAIPVEVDAGAAGRWQVWTDPASGAPLVRRSLTRWGTGTVTYDATRRWTGVERQTVPAPRVNLVVDGNPATSAPDGTVTWTGDSPVPVVVVASGTHADVNNVAGSAASASLTLSDRGSVVWSPGDDRDLDAQISAYVHTNTVNTYVRGFAGGRDFLDEQLPVYVNIDAECNANFNGHSINFFRASDQCENTATIADVVYHEFGHFVHARSLIRGAGFFDGAFSEGLSDYLAATITDDSGMGRGFFKSDAPLRELDPEDYEYAWPRDISEVHHTGLIFAGAMWDLRTALIAAHGYQAGVAIADQLFYAAVQRAPSIPTTLIEILAADDDDGDLDNGTPNECLIRAAFGAHGIRTITGHADAAAVVAASATDTSLPVTLTMTGLDHHCGDQISSVVLEWKPRGSNDSPRAGMADATEVGDGVWTAEMPLPDDGDVALYHVRVKFADQSDMVFPDNNADPWYQIYRGDLVPLYCTDFESDPFAEGWRARDDGAWQWGQPGGSAIGDPGYAYSGERVVGNGLAAGHGEYPDRILTWLETPLIETGQWSDVRLQYRRWLGVEDGYYDQATIEVNGQLAWANLSSHGNGNKTLHHQDKAWMFSDVSLSSRIFDGTVRIRWLLDTDGSFALGGWTLDDVCVVANVSSVCGDGRRSGAEQCDDGPGNAAVADACRPNCRVAFCGDGIVDSWEACDDGNEQDGDQCDSTCNPTPPGYQPAGCCSTGTPGAAALLPLGLALLAFRRRRRHA